MGPAPGQALRRRRRAYDDQTLRRQGRRHLPAGPRPRALEAREDRPRGRRPVRRRRRRPGRLAHRLRLGHGRGPRSSWLPRLTEAGPGRRGTSPTDFAASSVAAAWCGPSIRGRCRPRVLDRPGRPGRPRPVRRQHPGLDLVVLEGAEQPPGYWDVTLPPERRAGVPVAGAARRAGAGRCPSPIPRPTSRATPSPTRRRPASAGGRGLAGAVLDGRRRHRGHDACCWRPTTGLGALFFGLFQHEEAAARRARRARRPASCSAPSPSAGPRRMPGQAARGAPPAARGVPRRRSSTGAGGEAQEPRAAMPHLLLQVGVDPLAGGVELGRC